MTGLLPLVLTVVVFAMVLGALWWSIRRTKTRRAAGAVAGPFEEIWHPAAHRARLQVEIHDERIQPGSLPGDPPTADGLEDRRRAG